MTRATRAGDGGHDLPFFTAKGTEGTEESTTEIPPSPSSPLRLKKRSPPPVAHVRHVLAVLADVTVVVDELVGDPLFHVCRARAQLREAIDGVGGEMESKIGRAHV